MPRGTRAQRAMLVGLFLLLAALLLYPIWLTVRGGFVGAGGRFTLHHVLAVFDDPALRSGFLRSLAIAACTTTLAMVLAFPLAMLSVRCRFKGQALLGACVLVPLILPPFVGAIGLSQILGRSGALNQVLIGLGLLETGIDFIGRGGFWAIVAVEALHLYPIIFLNLSAALANLDPALEQAAENLGAGRWRRFRTVTLPLVRPGLFAGGTIVFIWSFTELGTPLMFDYQFVTPVQIFNGLKEMAVSHQPYALTVVMLASAALTYVLGKAVLGRGAHAMYSKASVHSTPRILRGPAGWAAAGLFIFVTALAVVPHLGVLLTSVSVAGRWYDTILPEAYTLEHYSGALSHPLAMGSIRNSLVYALLAMVIDLVLGVMIAYLVVRTRLRGRGLLDAMAMLPLAVPGLVMAFGYVAMTLSWPFAEGMPAWMNAVAGALLPGDWVTALDRGPLRNVADIIGAEPNPVPLLIVAYAVRRLPYVVRAAAAGLEQTPRELEEAAMNLGAGRLRTVRTVVLPLIAANLIAGGLLAFSFAMLEVSDSLILAQRDEHFPITKAIYVLYERLGDGPAIASAMGVWAMVLLAMTLIGASLMMGKRLGAIFRV